MTAPATDGKMLVNALYHSVVVSGLATGYARLDKMALGGSPQDFTPRDVGMVVMDVALALATKDKRDEKTGKRFTAGVVVGPTNLRATTGQLPKPMASTCWRPIGLLEYLADPDGAR